MKMQYNEDGKPFVIWGGHHVELERQPISDKFYKTIAENELRETPENVEKGLRELRQKLKEDISLVVPIDDDEFLLKFLRPSKFYADSAYKKIQAHYKFKQVHQDYCKDLIPSVVRNAIDYSVVSILGPRDQHGRRIIVLESGDRWNPREISLKEVFRGAQLVMEAATEEPRTQVAGVVLILDVKGLSFTHIRQFSPSFAKMAVDWIQESVPVRLKAIHIVNQPMIFNVLFAIFKPFLYAKLRSRIHFHGTNWQSLADHVDSSALRHRHGGKLPDPEISGEVLYKMLQHYEEEFTLAQSYGYINNNNNNSRKEEKYMKTRIIEDDLRCSSIYALRQ